MTRHMSYTDDIAERNETGDYNLADPDPGRTFLGILNRELMTATQREKETRAALAEHQAKADYLTRERESIERAINAYQQRPNIADWAQTAEADIAVAMKRHPAGKDRRNA